MRIGLAAFCAVFFASIAFGQNPLSVSKPEQDNSVAAELKSFALADGYEAQLFADETDGVANPVCMSWDPAGRLWVLCTWAYPQAKPVDEAGRQAADTRRHRTAMAEPIRRPSSPTG